MTRKKTVNLRVAECLRRLKREPTIVIDVETSGLDWKRNHIVGYVFTFGPKPEDVYYLPVRHAGGGNIKGCDIPKYAEGWMGGLHPIEIEIAKTLNERQNCTIIGHHLGFDLRFMFPVGVAVAGDTACTMVNAALLNELSRSFSLKACAKAADVPFKKGEELYRHLADRFGGKVDKKQMSNFWQTDASLPVVRDYALGDGHSTWHLRYWQQQRLRDQGLLRVCGVECRVIKVLCRMTTRGVQVDEERLHEVRKITQQRAKKARSTLPKDFNVRSSTQLKGLFTKHGITNWPMTVKGNPSFTRAWLETTKLGQAIETIREYDVLDSSFITPLLERHLHNGRVHPEYNQLRSDEYGTITGRLSSSNPNFQQVHKRNEELGRLYRSVFVPDEGMIWGTCDWNQCEPRLLAYYSRCKALINGYASDPPIDAHAVVAREANISRETGKRLNQALLTGAGSDKIAEMLGIDPVEGREVVDRYFAAMPEILTFRNKATNRLRSRGWVVSLLGRRARLETGQGWDMAYKALNRLLQCGNADMIKLKMVEVDDYLRSEGDVVHNLNSVHDALDFQFYSDHRAQYDRAGEIMAGFGEDDEITLDIPIIVDRGEGPNWAIATYGEGPCAKRKRSGKPKSKRPFSRRSKS